MVKTINSKSQKRGTNPPLRAPSEVFPTVAEPTLELEATREGAGARAIGEVTHLLMLIPRDYNVARMRPITDGVVLEMGDIMSVGVVREALEADGWQVRQSGLWRRFSFGIPANMSGLGTEVIIQCLLARNGRAARGPEGMPDRSMRFSSEAEESGSYPDGSRRRRVWVDISPEGVEYLIAHDYLLRTVTSGIRLRPATDSDPESGNGRS